MQVVPILVYKFNKNGMPKSGKYYDLLKRAYYYKSSIRLL